MLFSSVPFLFYFLPAALLLYFLVPRRLKNAALLLASLFFYAWGEPKYVVLMLSPSRRGISSVCSLKNTGDETRQGSFCRCRSS